MQLAIHYRMSFKRILNILLKGHFVGFKALLRLKAKERVIMQTLK